MNNLLNTIDEVKLYYTTHSTANTARHFKCARNTLLKYLKVNNIVEHTPDENKNLGVKQSTITCTKKYGVAHPAQAIDIQNKSKQTCLNKYGVEYSFQSENNKNKTKQTCLNKYGTEYATQSKAIKDKTKQTNNEKYGYDTPLCDIEKREAGMLQKYGVKNPLQSNEIKESIKVTNNEKYGTDWVVQTNTFKDKAIQTKLDKYGDINYNNREKYKETCLEKYGVDWYWISDDFLHKCHHGYEYDDEYFHSIPELAFWIYCKDNNIQIQRAHSVQFIYTYAGKNHTYFPDFIVNNIDLVEIKGKQFFKSDGTMCNPWNHELDALYEAKHQCGLQHNVKFITTKEYNKFLVYCQNKLGYNWYKKYYKGSINE